MQFLTLSKCDFWYSVKSKSFPPPPEVVERLKIIEVLVL
jgi:hypothetical protein